VAIVGVVALYVVIVVLSWHSAARRWRRTLPVTELLATVAALGRLTEETTVREWLPMRRHRAIAAAAEEVAAALKELADALPDTGNRLFIAPSFGTVAEDPAFTVHHPPSQELFDVVRGDLLELCRGALDPAWRAAEAGQRSAPGVYARRLDHLLGEYGARVQHKGLTASSPLGRDDARRNALLARLWSEAPAALAALRTDDDQPVVQLCRGGQLRYLSTASETGLLRFAPQPLRSVLEQDSAHHRLAADPGISWNEDGELVGALRLVPLRPESVRIVLGGDA
jgi:hypothetical protein